MDAALILQFLGKAKLGGSNPTASSPTKGIPIVKALSRSILSIVTVGGAAIFWTRAAATLQFSVGPGESSYTCVDNSSCDSNPAVGAISIPEISFDGITADNVTVTTTSNSLSFTVGSLTNDTGSTLSANFAVSDTGFSGVPLRFKTLFTTTWRDAAGSTIDVAWHDDPENTQGANTPTDTPGSQFDSFGSTTPGGNDTASHSATGALDISAPFSLSVGGSIDLASGGTESASEFVTVGSTVPEPSTWAMMLLGFAGLGFCLTRSPKAPVHAHDLQHHLPDWGRRPLVRVSQPERAAVFAWQKQSGG